MEKISHKDLSLEVVSWKSDTKMMTFGESMGSEERAMIWVHESRGARCER